MSNFINSKCIKIRIKHKGELLDVAAAQGFKYTTSQKVEEEHVLGEKEAIGTEIDQLSYNLTIDKAVLTKEAYKEDIDFHDLENFEVFIENSGNGKNIVYKGCNWENIDGDVKLQGKMTENVKIKAARREKI